MNSSFKKKDFVFKLDENESKVFSDFLIRARQLGILEFSGAKKVDIITLQSISFHYILQSNLLNLTI